MNNIKRIAAMAMVLVMTISQSNINIYAEDIDDNQSIQTLSENDYFQENHEEMVCQSDDLIVNDGDEDDIIINEENFPDENFRKLINNLPCGRDGVLTSHEISEVVEIVEEEGRYYGSKYSLKGIEYFINLENLALVSIYADKIDFSNNKELKNLSLDFGHLDEKEYEVNISENSKLENIEVFGNITNLDISNNKELKNLSIAHSRIKNIDVSNNNKLENFNGEYSYLESIDLSKNVKLKELNLDNTYITSLDLSNNNELKYLNCRKFFYHARINLFILPQSSDLEYLNCEYAIDTNLDTKIDLNKYKNLTYLNYGGNAGTQVDFTDCKKLTYIDIGFYSYDGTALQAFVPSEYPELQYLRVGGDGLKKVDVSKNKRLSTLEINGRALDELIFDNNNLLNKFRCGKCLIKQFDFANAKNIEELDVDYGGFETLDISLLTKLRIYKCKGSNIKELDLSNNPFIEELSCGNNELQELDLHGKYNLKKLSCEYNNISEIYLCDTRVFENENEFYVDQGYKKITKVIISEVQNEILESGDNKDASEQLNKENIEVEVQESGKAQILVDDNSFPDIQFKKYIKRLYDLEKDNILTENEIEKAKDMVLEDFEKTTSLDGIEKLTFLRNFSSSCGLTADIDFSNNEKLESVHIENAKGSSLNLGNNKYLKFVELDNNNFSDIIFSKKNNNINSISCVHGTIKSIDLTGMTSLNYLDVRYNNIENLYLIDNDALFTYDLMDNLFIGNQNENIIQKVHVTKEQKAFIEKLDTDGSWQKNNKINLVVHEHKLDDDKWYIEKSYHYKKCIECGKETVVETHVVEEIDDAKANCTESGTLGYYKCKCGYFEDSKCKVRIDDLEAWKKQHVVEPLGHSWNTGVITKQPTFFLDGIKEFACANCSEKYTEAVARLQTYEIPVKGKTDIKPAVKFLLSVSGNKLVDPDTAKFKYKLDNKKTVKISSKGILNAKNAGDVKVTVYVKGADKKYVEVCTLNILVKDTSVTNKITVNSLNETIKLDNYVSNIPEGYGVSFEISKANAKKVEFNKEANTIKPLKKGTVVVKCLISDGSKYVLKKNIKIVVKLPKN